MVLNYHIIIIILLLVVIFLLLILFKEKSTIEKFYYKKAAESRDEIPYKLSDVSEEDCEKWKSYGECTTNWQYMTVKCPDQCSNQVEDIEKHNKKCEKWAADNYCNDAEHKDYMKKQCKTYCKE